MRFVAALAVLALLSGNADDDWQKARSYAPHAGMSAAEERNAWLATAEHLEELLQEHPDHVPAMRDLLVAYQSLLGTFGAPADLPARMSARLASFESRAAPLSAADRALDARMRATLFLNARIYPAAFRASTEGDDVRFLLEKLGAGAWDESPPFEAAPFTIRVSHAKGTSPDPGLLWGETWFVASRGGEESPEHTVACVLASQGAGAKQRWYLVYRSVAGERVVALYGAKRPGDAALRKQVEALLSEETK